MQVGLNARPDEGSSGHLTSWQMQCAPVLALARRKAFFLTLFCHFTLAGLSKNEKEQQREKRTFFHPLHYVLNGHFWLRTIYLENNEKLLYFFSSSFLLPERLVPHVEGAPHSCLFTLLHPVFFPPQESNQVLTQNCIMRSLIWDWLSFCMQHLPL